MPAFCARCIGEVAADAEESCWFCMDDLCVACWELTGHCGHEAAYLMDEMANAGVRFRRSIPEVARLPIEQLRAMAARSRNGAAS